MKTIKNQNSLQSNGIKDTVKFGIKQSGLAHIFNVLRNQLYSDREMACLREYTCNAVDAHIENKCSMRPIEVKLPTRLDLTLKIRDYGKALTDQEIQDVYAFYGESTKRNTNDQIGQLGLGSKSAFAYGDNFVINSFLDGKLHTYNAFIDPSQIGQISKLGIADTDEENGIEIVIPIRDEDVQSFEDKAVELFQYFPVKPIVTGCDASKFDYKKQNVLFEGTNWEWIDVTSDRYDRGNAIAVMGNIGYPIDESSLGLNRNDDSMGYISGLLTSNLRLNVPIGDLEISASREKLQYTDHTRKSLISMLETVRDELADTVSAKFDDCKTLFDAKCLYGSIFNYSSPLYSLRQTLKKKLKFDGKDVTSDEYSVYNYDDIDVHTFNRRYSYGKFKVEESHRIDCEERVVIVENDLGHRRGVMGRVLPLLIDQDKKVYLVHYKDAKQKKKFIEDDNFDAVTTKLSDLEQHKLSEFAGYESTASGSTGEKNKKHSAKCFEFKFDADIRRYDRKKSDWWRITDVDIENDSGVFVIIDQFCPLYGATGGYGSQQDPSRLKRMKSDLEQIGITFPSQVVGMKIKQRAKIENKDGWVNFFDWAKAKVKAVIKDGDLWEKYANAQHLEDLQGHDALQPLAGRWKNMDEIFKNLALAGKLVVDEGGLFSKMIEQYKDMSGEKQQKYIKAVKQMANDYDLGIKPPKNVKPTHNLKNTISDVLKRYEMLQLMDNHSLQHHFNDKTKNAISNYINVVDLSCR